MNLNLAPIWAYYEEAGSLGWLQAQELGSPVQADSALGSDFVSAAGAEDEE